VVCALYRRRSRSKMQTGCSGIETALMSPRGGLIGEVTDLNFSFPKT
jgi:hypothetical protein